MSLHFTTTTQPTSDKQGPLDPGVAWPIEYKVKVNAGELADKFSVSATATLFVLGQDDLDPATNLLTSGWYVTGNDAIIADSEPKTTQKDGCWEFTWGPDTIWTSSSGTYQLRVYVTVLEKDSGMVYEFKMMQMERVIVKW